MTNFYDTWSQIFDDNGKPLVGKISFYKPDTEELKTIYDIDGNVLSNPIYCNGLPTSQIMLDNGDYDVKFYRYIGNGNMEDDFNEDSWFNYKTIFIKDNSVETIISHETTEVVGINELKNINNMNDGDMAHVMGYYTIDDCPSRYFIWHENGNYTDDGGITIKSNHTTNGAWVMKIPSTYVDVRWYGDIADSDTTRIKSNPSQRTKAANAANTYGKDLYFPKVYSNTYGFYIFDGANTLVVNQDIILDRGVRFVVKEGTNGTLIQCKELFNPDVYLMTAERNKTIGEYTLVADWINNSWIPNEITYNVANPREGFIYDKSRNAQYFKDCKIKFVKGVSIYDGSTLNNVEVVEGESFITNGSIGLYHMDYDRKYLSDDYDPTNLRFSYTNIKIEKCLNADEYIVLKNKNYDYHYGDLKEQVLNNAPIMGNSLLENFNGTIRIIEPGYIEIHNGSFEITEMPTYNNDNLYVYFNLVDCWVSSNQVIECVLSHRRGQWNGTLLSLKADSRLENVNINTQISTFYKLELINCEIFKEIDTLANPNTNVVDFYIKDSTFHSYHWIKNLTGTPNALVVGKWIDNYSDTAENFVQVVMLNIDYLDNHHSYVYSGNTGEHTLSESPEVTYRTFIQGIKEEGDKQNYPFYLVTRWSDNTSQTCYMIDVTQYNDASVKFFAIGGSTISVDVTIGFTYEATEALIYPRYQSIVGSGRNIINKVDNNLVLNTDLAAWGINILNVDRSVNGSLRGAVLPSSCTIKINKIKN